MPAVSNATKRPSPPAKPSASEDLPTAPNGGYSRARPEVSGNAPVSSDTAPWASQDPGSCVRAEELPVMGVQLGFMRVQLAVEAIYTVSGRAGGFPCGRGLPEQ
jgi:hypothetical protein